MASQNCSSLDTWTLRSPLTVDSWFSETLMSRETDALTRALQLEICNTDSLASFPKSTSLAGTITTTTTTTTSATSSETDGSLPASSRHTTLAPPPTGRISKRKSRASKKSPTTFINADPANFRQMVQQITGIRCPTTLGGSSLILKPEPQRPQTGLHVGAAAGGMLPTLDTSAFLLNHPVSAQPDRFGFDTVQPNPTLDFPAFPTPFPTLESWRVM
ncbi:unnamed protein product [Victoria cruziana]